MESHTESQGDRFSSRWGLILAAMGMAIGTGNIWRFPRIIATHGGGMWSVDGALSGSASSGGAD